MIAPGGDGPPVNTPDTPDRRRRRGPAEVIPAAPAGAPLRLTSRCQTLAGHAHRRPRGSRVPGALISEPTWRSSRPIAVRPENTRWTGRNMSSLPHRARRGHGCSPSAPAPPVAVLVADAHTIA